MGSLNEAACLPVVERATPVYVAIEANPSVLQYSTWIRINGREQGEQLSVLLCGMDSGKASSERRASSSRVRSREEKKASIFGSEWLREARASRQSEACRAGGGCSRRSLRDRAHDTSEQQAGSQKEPPTISMQLHHDRCYIAFPKLQMDQRHLNCNASSLDWMPPIYAQTDSHYCAKLRFSSFVVKPNGLM
jgi:hypothetical protein